MHNSLVKNIVIVGGGTAGWMTAASLSKNLKINNLTITLIESEDIGTVGVGEATIPSIRSFNESLGIDEIEFLKATQATFKLGIEFKNWREIDSSFFHPFADYGIDLGGIGFYHYLHRLRAEGHNYPLADFSFPTQLAKQGRFAQPHPNPPTPLADFGYAYHFDAGRYALYLRDYAEARGVRRLEGKVNDIHCHASGDIKELRTDSGEVITGDLFIDCSGFRGLLIEQTLHTGYDDWRRWLPCDRAIAVQSEKTSEATPYTRTTAQDAGWQWRIPLQHRTGNGYVYASAFCDASTAEATLLQNLDGTAITSPRQFEFVTGKRKKIWNRNCFAIGLSGGFLEPLESTSISLIQTGITKLLEFFPYRGLNEHDTAEVNRQHGHEFERIRDFLVLHYKATKRDDTEFWRHCQNMDIPDTLAQKMALYESRGYVQMLEPEAFERDSWVTMYEGFKRLPKDYDRRADAMATTELEAALQNMRASVAKAASQPLTHGEFIERHCQAPKPD